MHGTNALMRCVSVYGCFVFMCVYTMHFGVHSVRQGNFSWIFIIKQDTQKKELKTQPAINIHEFYLHRDVQHTHARPWYVFRTYGMGENGNERHTHSPRRAEHLTWHTALDSAMFRLYYEKFDSMKRKKMMHKLCCFVTKKQWMI